MCQKQMILAQPRETGKFLRQRRNQGQLTDNPRFSALPVMQGGFLSMWMVVVYRAARFGSTGGCSSRLSRGPPRELEQIARFRSMLATIRKNALPAAAVSGILRAAPFRCARILFPVDGRRSSNDTYFEGDGLCDLTFTLARNCKVPFVGHLDSHHFSGWPRHGAPSLLSRRLGRPARRAETIAG